MKIGKNHIYVLNRWYDLWVSQQRRSNKKMEKIIDEKFIGRQEYRLKILRIDAEKCLKEEGNSVAGLSQCFAAILSQRANLTKDFMKIQFTGDRAVKIEEGLNDLGKTIEKIRARLSERVNQCRV